MLKGNQAVALLRMQVDTARQWLEGTMQGVTPEQAHWAPPGTALPIGATYAHVVTGQDGMVNGMLRGKPPRFAVSHAGKTGLSELPPGPDPARPGFPDWTEWSRRVRVDLPLLLAYGEAVFEDTDAWLATLSDADLERPVDLSAVGMGTVPLAFVLNNAVLGNAIAHCGEIACLKGVQGGRGYAL